MAVSFDKLYSLDKVYDIFRYDVDLLWFPVNTGVETDQRNGPLLSVVDNLIGLPQFAHTLEYEPGSGGNFSLQDEGDSEKKEAAFIRGLEFLLEHENWAKKAYRGREEELMLRERLDYVRENGLKVYGAVITGPTKELLRLKEVKEIKYPVLGETTGGTGRCGIIRGQSVMIGGQFSCIIETQQWHSSYPLILKLILKYSPVSEQPSCTMVIKIDKRGSSAS